MAVVDKVVSGKHGLYAVAHADQLDGSVTFLLKPPVWQESSLPERGIHVILSDVKMKDRGWRSDSVRYVRPSDRKQFSKQKRAESKKENKNE